MEDIMKTAVIYLTKTGHSKKIAEAVAAALSINAQDIKTEPELSDVDLLFIVGGIYASKSDPKMIAYIKKIDGSMVRKAALITSCASNRIKQDMVRKALGSNNIEVLADELICKGSLLFLRPGQPNITEIGKAVSYAKAVANI
jgi:flavodoxin